MAKMAASTTSN